jgi:hypothetical protein
MYLCASHVGHWPDESVEDAYTARSTSRPISFTTCGRMMTAQCKKSTPTLFIACTRWPG